MSRRVVILETADALGLAVAQDIAARLRARAGPFLLGCPGGRSPRPVYAALSRLARAQRLDLSQLIIVMMDDYLTPAMDHVPENAHYSCRRFAREEILAVLNAELAPLTALIRAISGCPILPTPPPMMRALPPQGGLICFCWPVGQGMAMSPLTRKARIWPAAPASCRWQTRRAATIW